MTDDEDLETLFVAEYPRLARALGPDAAQAAFVQAYVHWRRVRRYDDPAAWVRRVAVNRLADERRSRRRQEAVAGRLSAGSPPPPEAAPHHVLDRVDPDLLDAVKALPRQQRIAVALHYLADLPVADVATAMSISEGSVKTHLSRARIRLASRLEALRAD